VQPLCFTRTFRDVVTKQLIEHINDNNSNRIILARLDDEHVLIRAEYWNFVKQEVEALLEANIYTKDA
jgi:Transcription factor TFIIH complex subunit Tfb5